MRMSQRKGFGKLVFYGSIPTKENFLEKEKWPFSFSCCLGEKEKNLSQETHSPHNTTFWGWTCLFIEDGMHLTNNRGK